MPRHGIGIQLPHFVRHFNRGKLLAYALLHVIRIHIAHHHKGDLVRAIPIPIEAFERVIWSPLDHLTRADRKTLRVTRTFQEYGRNLVPHPLIGTTSHPPLLKDHSTLLINLFFVKTEPGRPIPHHQ
ncbi:MAG: hypothetical protein BWY82_02716 [Verrucomicrobia bacterium ADurb.Bin474]|nr:MAG: hypothetical protein BWY82_02716 [Verrucomicrobia bacterium ADurb.Bin474]